MKPLDALAIVNEFRGDFDAPLVMGFIETESGRTVNGSLDFNERAFLMDRNGGSYGLMQLDLATARDRGYKGDGEGLYDPRVNIEYGTRQLRWLRDILKNHSAFGLQTMIAAYNEGIGNALKGNPDPRYVAKVIGARNAWQQRLGLGVS